MRFPTLICDWRKVFNPVTKSVLIQGHYYLKLHHKNSTMAVELKAIGVTYKRSFRKDVKVLHHVDMSVPKGAVYGLLGPSGCGKTTLLRCIVGSIIPSSGTVHVFGKIPRAPGSTVGYMPQEMALISDLTIEEIVLYYGRVLLMEDKDLHQRIDFLVKLLNLPDKNRTIKCLSGGQRRRVSLAIAIVHQPPLVILDEPTVGVDPVLRQSIWDHLFELSNEKGCSVIVTTHYNEEAARTHVVGMMRSGRLLVQSTPNDLFQTYNTTCIDDTFLQLCYTDNITKITDHAETTGRYRKLSFDEGILTPTSEVRDSQVQNNSFLNSKRLSASTKKNFAVMKRNLILLGTLFLYPLVPSLLCYCVWSDRIGLHGLHMSFVKEDQGMLANQFMNQLDKYIIIQTKYTSMKEAYNSVLTGNSWGVIHIRHNFSYYSMKRVEDGLGADDETLEFSEITINLAMTSPLVTSVIKQELYRSYEKVLQEYNSKQSNFNIATLKSPIAFGNPIYGEKEPTLLVTSSTFLIASLMYMTTASLASLSLVTEREQGSADRIRVAGLSTAELILSSLIVQFTTILIQAALLIGFIALVNQVTVKGPIVLAVSLTILQGVCGMTHGFLLSTIFTDIRGIIAGILGTIFPMILTGGFLWPMEGMPIWLQYFSRFTPMNPPYEAMKSIYNRGWGLLNYQVSFAFGVVCSWIIAFIILSFISLRFQSRQ